ncbi:MAG: HAD family hydrolase [Myxococcaceae bacterium]
MTSIHPHHHAQCDCAMPTRNDTSGPPPEWTTLQEVFPNHGDLRRPEHAWLRAFRDANPAQRTLFDAVFEGHEDHLHYRHDVTPAAADAARRLVAAYRAALEAGVSGKAPFRDGLLASFLGQLSPQLKVLGHHYDDVFRVVRSLFTGETPQTYANAEDSGATAHKLEARTGLHLHAGKAPHEVGLVLALALSTAFVVDRYRKRLPWVAQVALKATGAWPLFGHLIRGELTHALAHVKKGEQLQDVVKQLLVTLLVTAGVVRRGGTHELTAGTVMASILALVGHVQTNAATRSFDALGAALDSLPKKAEVVHKDHTHKTPVDKLKVGSVLALKRGDTLPCDATLVALPNGESRVLVDPYRSRGQMAQHYSPGDRLDQGSVILDDALVHARVEAKVEDSTLYQQVHAQRRHKPSKRQSTAKQVGDFWVWGTLAGTVLVTLKHLLKPATQGAGINLDHVLHRATSFATLASPCGILVSTMIEGAASRGLVKEGLIPLSPQGLAKAATVRDYCFDYTGTLTMGGELSRATFFDVNGQALGSSENASLLLTAAALGLKAGSQHLRQKALRRAVFASASPKAVEEASRHIEEAHEDIGQGIRGQRDGQPLRLGKAAYVALEPGLSAAQRALIESTSQTREHSITWVWAEGKLGMVEYTDGLRPGARATIDALGTANGHVLTGDNNRAFVLEGTRALGIPDEQVFTDLSPEDKAKRVKALKLRGPVAMVVDGLNDAAAAREADVRYALADTVHDGILSAVDFLTPNLASIPPSRKLAHKVNMTSTWTLGLSIAWTALTSVLDGLGFTRLSPIVATAIHEGPAGLTVPVHNWIGGRIVDEFANARDALLPKKAA